MIQLVSIVGNCPIISTTIGLDDFLDLSIKLFRSLRCCSLTETAPSAINHEILGSKTYFRPFFKFYPKNLLLKLFLSGVCHRGHIGTIFGPFLGQKLTKWAKIGENEH